MLFSVLYVQLITEAMNPASIFMEAGVMTFVTYLRFKLFLYFLVWECNMGDFLLMVTNYFYRLFPCTSVITFFPPKCDYF